MDRSQKAESVAQLNAVFNEVGVVVVTRNLGLSVGQSTDLRAKMRDVGATYKVAKNRLAKLALKDTQYQGLEDYLTGPTGLAWSTDPVAAAKAAVDFAKTNDKLEIVGGALGRTPLNAEGVKALATMPSLDQLRATLAGMLKQPGTRIASVLQAPGGAVARVISAHAEKSNAA